jgi:hypothetical protein
MVRERGVFKSDNKSYVSLAHDGTDITLNRRIPRSRACLVTSVACMAGFETASILPSQRRPSVEVADQRQWAEISCRNMPRTIWGSCERKSLVWPRWPSVAPPLSSKYSEVGSTKATKSAPIFCLRTYLG